MEKPAHILSFLMGYPQYRDYYLYHTKAKSPVWPFFLLAAGGIIAAICLFLCLTNSAGFSPQFFLETKALSALCAGSAAAGFVGKMLQLRRQSKKWYRQKQLGKRKTEIRFYEKFFTVHYPSVAFDGYYTEICQIDRIRRLTVLRLKNGMEIPVSNEIYSQQLETFLTGRLPDLAAGQSREKTENESPMELLGPKGD